MRFVQILLLLTAGIAFGQNNFLRRDYTDRGLRISEYRLTSQSGSEFLSFLITKDSGGREQYTLKLDTGINIYPDQGASVTLGLSSENRVDLGYWNAESNSVVIKTYGDDINPSILYKIFTENRVVFSAVPNMRSLGVAVFNATTYRGILEDIKRNPNADKLAIIIADYEVAKATPTTIEIVFIPGGSFDMGISLNDARSVFAEITGEGSEAYIGNLSPPFSMSIKTFLLGKTEVTYEQFERFVRATRYRTTAERGNNGQRWSNEEKKWVTDPNLSWKTPGFQQGPRQPVVLVTMEDIANYCNWLSREEGLTPAYMNISDGAIGSIVALIPDSNGYR